MRSLGQAVSLFSAASLETSQNLSWDILSHGFLPDRRVCVELGRSSGVFLSCSSALRLPPSINGLFECDGSKVLKLFQFLTSC